MLGRKVGRLFTQGTAWGCARRQGEGGECVAGQRKMRMRVQPECLLEPRHQHEHLRRHARMRLRQHGRLGETDMAAPEHGAQPCQHAAAAEQRLVVRLHHRAHDGAGGRRQRRHGAHQSQVRRTDVRCREPANVFHVQGEPCDG